jgi:hypothetical protein
MKITQCILYYLLLINLNSNAFFNNHNQVEQEIKRHFNTMLNAVNELPTYITDESSFPQITTISPTKLEIDATDPELFLISLSVNEIIKPENITTEKGSNYIKIEVNFDQTYYQIILKENEVSMTAESSHKIKNTHNTKYSHSSSHMSRQEKLNKHIDLHALKIKVDAKEKTIEIITKYKDMKKNSGIDIEFK